MPGKKLVLGEQLIQLARRAVVDSSSSTLDLTVFYALETAVRMTFTFSQSGKIL